MELFFLFFDQIQIFHPVFAKLLPLTSQNKLKIVKDGFGEYEIPKDKNKYNIEYFNLENVFKLNIDSVKKELSKKLNVKTFDQIYYNIKQNSNNISSQQDKENKYRPINF